MVAQKRRTSGPATTKARRRATARRRPEAVFRGGISTMTSKGQVTITTNLREALGLKPGDRLLMMLQEDGSLRVRRLRSADELVGVLAVAGIDVRADWRELNEAAQEELAAGSFKYKTQSGDR